jgi:hypothetical protein
MSIQKTRVIPTEFRQRDACTCPWLAKRKLKVEENGTAYEAVRRVPLVRLKGQWLRAAGFAPGQRVEICLVAMGHLQIRLVEPVPEDSRQLIQAELLFQS